MKQDPELPVRRSIRLPHFDYSQPAAYFVTICTHDKRHLFGVVAGHEVALSGPGKIVDECWREIPTHFPNVELATHVVMPNHVHGIIVIRSRVPVAAEQSSVARRIGAHRAASLPTIVRSFKAITTRRIHDEVRAPSAEIWQRGYHEHIIRNEDEFHKTCDYIRLNPANWTNDEENS